jgi:arylsulfatase A-like enzyme
MNVLLIVGDDLGVDQVQSWHQRLEPPRTPVIDSLSASGVNFENTWAYPDCSPTRAAMLTGRYGRRTGVGQRVGNMKKLGWEYTMPLDEITIPEMLKTAPEKWASSMTGKWHLTNFHAADHWATNPNEQGFDWWSGTTGNLSLAMGDGHVHNYYDWERIENGVAAFTQHYATTDSTDDGIARIAAMSEPWFMYMAYQAPHAPFMAPPPELLDSDRPTPRGDRQKYTASVEALDKEIGRLLASIPPDVRARTTIIFLGDNGTPGEVVAPPLDPKRSKISMFEGGVRVPLIVSGPLVRSPGSWSKALVDVVDVFPTIAEIAHVDTSQLQAGGAPVPLDGYSLLPYLVDPTAPSQHAFLYSERFAPNGPPPYQIDDRAVRDDDFKLVRNEKSGLEALFDLHATQWWLDEGPNLLESGQPLTAVQQDHLAALRAEMDRQERALSYAHGDVGRPPDAPIEEDDEEAPQP